MPLAQGRAGVAIAKLAALVPKPRVNQTRFARIIPDTHPLHGPAKAVQIHSR